MTRPTPLPWVKSWTSRMTDFDWLALSPEDRCVFLELVTLGGCGWPRGEVKGTDAAIAAGLRIDVNLLTAAVDRLVAKPHRSLKRLASGVRVVNWDKYQAPGMALSHAQRGDTYGESKSRGREEEEQRRHVLLEGYPSWVHRRGDALELDRLATKYPSLDLAEELLDFMAYADRRAGEGNAYVDYIAAFRNRLKSQSEYYKKRGWTSEATEDLTPAEARDRLRVVS